MDKAQIADQFLRLLKCENGGSIHLSELPKKFSTKFGSYIPYQALGFRELSHMFDDPQFENAGLYITGLGNDMKVCCVVAADSTPYKSNTTPKLHRYQLLEEAWCTVCFSCNQPLREPLLAPCNHIFCKGCVTRLFVRQKRARLDTAPCPECQSDWRLEADQNFTFLFNSPGLYRTLYSLLTLPQVRCAKRECPWRGKISQYTVHVEQECEQKMGEDVKDFTGRDLCFPYADGRVSKTDAMILDLLERISEVSQDGEDPKYIKVAPEFIDTLSEAVGTAETYAIKRRADMEERARNSTAPPPNEAQTPTEEPPELSHKVVHPRAYPRVKTEDGPSHNRAAKPAKRTIGWRRNRDYQEQEETPYFPGRGECRALSGTTTSESETSSEASSSEIDDDRSPIKRASTFSPVDSRGIQSESSSTEGFSSGSPPSSAVKRKHHRIPEHNPREKSVDRKQHRHSAEALEHGSSSKCERKKESRHHRGATHRHRSTSADSSPRKSKGNRHQRVSLRNSLGRDVTPDSSARGSRRSRRKDGVSEPSGRMSTRHRYRDVKQAPTASVSSSLKHRGKTKKPEAIRVQAVQPYPDHQVLVGDSLTIYKEDECQNWVCVKRPGETKFFWIPSYTIDQNDLDSLRRI
eukprot:GHVN01089905.1.p1 GENE.GHVN01089905.1~~GHVN01089905.1.p1  ORF type:complete len:634 (+),score=36.15 GHVN01089905.1:749-2650(+)